MADRHDERFSIEGDPEDALRGLLAADPAEVRWHIVFVDTGNVAPPPNRPEGYATEDEALEAHATVLEGNPKLEVRAVRTP